MKSTFYMKRIVLIICRDSLYVVIERLMTEVYCTVAQYGQQLSKQGQ